MTVEPNDSIPTRLSLVNRLRAGDDTSSWKEFYQLYGPLIRNFALKAGLTEDEAEEVVQETAISVARHLPGFVYDPKVCAFRTWLLHLTKWRLHDQVRKRRALGGTPAGAPADGSPGSGSEDSGEGRRTATIERVPDPAVPDFGAEWDAAFDRHLLDHALAAVKCEVDVKQYQAYDLYVLKEWPARDVAETLGTSVASVYLTKHRMAKLLKKEIARLEKLARERFA